MNDNEQFLSGALIDTRGDAEKENDYQFGEIVAATNPVNWVEKPQSAWRKFPIFNQDGSGSCVAQTLVKLLGILYWLKNQLYVHFSATHIYQRRSNKPSGGMAGVDAFNIARKGATLEELVPSQNMTDSQMDGTEIPQYKQDVGSVFKIGNYVSLPIKDIDTIASVIQTTSKAVMVWFYFKGDEWTDVPTIKYSDLNLYASDTSRHSVTAVDFALYQGKKALIIEDSWGQFFGLNGQRVITEDFLRVRNWFAAYPISFAFEDQTQPQPQPSPGPTKPKYTFTKPLEFIPWDSAKNQPANVVLHENQKTDVVALQNILKYEGHFPSNVASTGYYGSITAKAVYAFQVAHKVAPLSELDSLRGRRVGPKTIRALNEIYSL
ncbi:MAG: peptidoglycan-binding protein [Patescibacteria group bacterium]|nr:peptidoglycan-binding protein [Patescibacteria group bacterium]